MSDNQTLLQRKKSKLTSFLLTLFFGPFGLFYSTIKGALIMWLIYPIIVSAFYFLAILYTSKLFFYLTLLLTVLYLPICIIWGILAVNSYNQNTSIKTQFNKFKNKISQNLTATTNSFSEATNIILFLCFLFCLTYALMDIFNLFNLLNNNLLEKFK